MTTHPPTHGRGPSRRIGPPAALAAAALLLGLVAGCSSQTTGAGWTLGPTLAPPASGAAPSSGASAAPAASPGAS